MGTQARLLAYQSPPCASPITRAPGTVGRAGTRRSATEEPATSGEWDDDAPGRARGQPCRASTAIEYALEQQLLPRRLTIDELFDGNAREVRP